MPGPVGSRCLATTRRGGAVPLQVAGRPVWQAWAELHRFLGEALSPAHARLLAEPRAGTGDGGIEWHGPPGTPHRPTAADRRRLKAQADDVRRLAADLRRTADSHRQALGQMLELALQTPADSDVFVIGEQPVLTSWGHRAVPTRAVWPQMLLVAALLLIAANLAWGLSRWLQPPPQAAAVAPAERQAIIASNAARDQEQAARRVLADLRQQEVALRLQCAPAAKPTPKAPGSSMAPEVKPSMPGTPKRAIDVQPAEPLRSR